MTDVLTKSQRRKNMQHIKARDSKAEMVLRKELWHRGIRYRKNYTALPGKPDVAITKYRIAIFVDGDFWHARGHQEAPGEQIGTNQEFWSKKLKRNVERDREVNETLLEQGWIVLRYWESDILKDLEGCVAGIMEYMPNRIR